MNLKDENASFALLKAVGDAIQGHIAETRVDHLATLLEHYDEDGSPKFTVRLPDGTKVATIILPEAKESFEVQNEVAFLEWVWENRPDLVEEVHVPPQVAMDYEQVSVTGRAQLLKGLSAGPDGIAFDSQTGLVVEGVAYKPAGRPTSFSVRYETEGRERVIDAWRTGELQHLVGSDVLPQIGGTS